MPGSSVIEHCNDDDATVTSYTDGPVITVWSTIDRESTLGVVTALYTTTLVQTAFCHYQTPPLPPQVDAPAPMPANPRPAGCNDCRPWYGKGGWGWERGHGGAPISGVCV